MTPVHFRPVHGLDTVDDRCVRLQFPDLLLDCVQGVLCQHIHITFNAQPPGPQLDLPGGFLTADVQRTPAALRQVVADLE